MPEGMLNTQITESVEYANHTVVGNAPSHSSSMLDALMAETIGMAMHNAVTTQHNAQMIATAAVTATCARMLKVQFAGAGGAPARELAPRPADEI